MKDSRNVLARRCWRGLAAGAAGLMLLTAPPLAHAVSEPLVEAHAGLPDFDARMGFLLPTQAQLDAVAAMGATARWNIFGTPASLINHAGFLGSAPGADPTAAAREWVRAHRELFRLSDADVTALELVNAARMPDSPGRAVLFRQSFGGLTAAQDGMIIVGLVDGQVAYASSSAVGSQAAPAAPLLSPAEAWLAAAANVGRVLSLADLSAPSQDNSWTVFTVPDFAQPQRARLVALPTPLEGVKAAYETIVLDVKGGSAQAYTSFVDARTGQVLFRQNRVQNLAQTDTFSGAYEDAPAAQACGPLHPFEVPEGTKTLTVAAQASIPSNDIILRLLFNGAVVASQDTATSPEALYYTPASLTPGVYNVQVCPYGSPSAPPVAPYTYVGTFTAHDVEMQPLATVPRWRIFTANPRLDFSSTDTRLDACWTTAEGCDFSLSNIAARAPWDVDFRTGLPTFTTVGNAAITAEAWLSPLTPAEQYRPVSPLREYSFPWTNQWYQSRCSPASFSSLERNDVDAAAANLFAMHNRMHDWSYFLGFTEENYNLQSSNFGNTAPGPYPLGREVDPEVGNVQAGALTGGAPSYLGRDNANQITLNDGIAGITNMYLWQPIAGAFYSRCVDGDYDMSVIGHEYTHAISNRMAGGPDGNLSGLQAGAMGESWSDLTAVEYLFEHGYSGAAGENPFAVGAYVTGHPTRGIRNYGMNQSPLNYSNVGYDFSGPQVHADGEIWSAVNHDLRAAFMGKYDAAYPSSDAQLQRECAEGKRPASLCPGNRRWMQLVFDAYLLMQPGVSMVDARDAYLAADKMRFGGANQALMWREFARRGLGAAASSTTSADTTPVPSFETPAETNEAVVTFNAVAIDEERAPVKARVYVGDYEARSRPVADTDPTTPLPSTVLLVPGTYRFVVQADGYGMHRFTRTLRAGEAVVLEAELPTNWASRAQGAAASGDGVNLDKLIDDTESTNWARLSTASVEGTQMTVALAGGPRTVRTVHVSAMLRPADANDPGGDTGSQNRFTALRSFEVYACNASALNLDCALDASFTRVYESGADAFPGDVPRPAAPDVLLRSFDIPATTATHLRLRVVSNQCTGGPAFQGDQDADSLNDTDCVRGSSAANAVRAAEFQAFSGGGKLVEYAQGQ